MIILLHEIGFYGSIITLWLDWCRGSYLFLYCVRQILCNQPINLICVVSAVRRLLLYRRIKPPFHRLCSSFLLSRILNTYQHRIYACENILGKGGKKILFPQSRFFFFNKIYYRDSNDQKSCEADMWKCNNL